MTGVVEEHPQSHHERMSGSVVHLPDFDDILCTPRKVRLSATSSIKNDDQFPNDSSFRLDDLINFDTDDDGDADNDNNKHGGSRNCSTRTESSASSSSNRPQEKQNVADKFLMKSEDQKSYQESLAASWSSLDFLDSRNDQVRTSCQSDDGDTKQRRRGKRPVKRSHSTTGVPKQHHASTSDLGGPIARERWKDPRYKKNRKKGKKKKKEEEISHKSAAELLEVIMRGKPQKEKRSRKDSHHKSAADLLNDILLEKDQKPSRSRSKSTPSKQVDSNHKSMSEITKLKRAKSYTPKSNSGRRRNNSHKSSSAINTEELWKPKASRNHAFDGSASVSSIGITADFHQSSGAILQNTGPLGKSRTVRRNRSFDGSSSLRSARSFAFKPDGEETLQKLKEAWQSSSSSILGVNAKAKNNNMSDMHDSSSLQVYPIDFGFGFSSAAHSPSVRRERKTVSITQRQRTKSAEPRLNNSFSMGKSVSSIRTSDLRVDQPPPSPPTPIDDNDDDIPGATPSTTLVRKRSKNKKNRGSLKKQVSDSRLVNGSSNSASPTQRSNPKEQSRDSDEIYGGEAVTPGERRKIKRNSLREGLKRSASSSYISRTRDSPSVTSSSARTSRTASSSGSGSRRRSERKRSQLRRTSSFSQVIHTVDKWKKKQTKEEEQQREDLLVRQNSKDNFHSSFSTLATAATGSTSQSNVSSGSGAPHKMNPQLARELDQYFAQAYVRNLTFRGKKFAGRGNGGDKGSHQVVVL